jgi:hypothetical protein
MQSSRLQQHVAIGVNPDDGGNMFLLTLSAHSSDSNVLKSRRQNMNFAYSLLSGALQNYEILLNVCTCVRPYGTTRFPLDEFS